MKIGKINYKQLMRALEHMSGDWGLEVRDGTVEVRRDD